MVRLSVFGSLHMDVIVRAPDRPRKGETLRGEAWNLSAGGKGGNQAAQAARQGAEVYMIGRVGVDDFGIKLIESQQRAGVDTRHIRSDSTAGSGMSVAIVDAQGDYGAVIVSGVNMNMDSSDIETAADTIRSSQYLILQYEIPLDLVTQVARFARESGTGVILNAAPAYPAPPGLLEAVDVLVVNEIEAEMLAGIPVTSLEEAHTVAGKLGQEVPTVVITLGSQGAVAQDRDHGLIHVSGYPVEVVDTHGAGDAFIGALAVRLAAGDPLPEALAYANASAALMVMHAGPQPDHISAKRVRDFMQKRGSSPLS